MYLLPLEVAIPFALVAVRRDGVAIMKNYGPGVAK